MSEKPEVKKQYYTRLMDLYRYNSIYIPFLNDLIRFVQKRKYQREYKSIQRLSLGKGTDIKEWYNQHDFFFGFGVYRSGTTFLANFLNRHVSHSIIAHEANVNDYWSYARVLQSEKEATEYISEYRLNEVYFRLSDKNFQTYGEINPFLRRHCKAIKMQLPEVKQFQVVRNPRNVLRSLMSRELFGRKDPMGKLITPPDDDPYREEWERWGRFEKLCWMWAADNRLLRETCGHTVKFELLRKDYDYFKENILDYLSLEMDSQKWHDNIRRIKNPTPRYTFPKFDDWESKFKKAMERLCGNEMAHYDY